MPGHRTGRSSDERVHLETTVYEFSLVRHQKLLISFRDKIQAHCPLYLKVNLLHSDISENNIIETNPDDISGFAEMLIDLDLAKVLSSRRSSA